jgi:hypothetical protein
MVVVSTGTVVVAIVVVIGAIVVVVGATVVVVVGVDVPEPESTYIRRFGEPVPADVTRFGVAAVTRASRTWVGVRALFAPRRRAAAPATWGEAMDVPLMVFVAVDDVYQADLMLEPGAKMSRQLPKFE